MKPVESPQFRPASWLSKGFVNQKKTTTAAATTKNKKRKKKNKKKKKKKKRVRSVAGGKLERQAVNRIRPYYPLLSLIDRLPLRDRETLFPHLNLPASDSICEVVANALDCKGGLPLEQKNALKSDLDFDQDNLRYLCNIRSASRPHRRARLSQSGAGIGLILSTILPLLARLIHNVVVPNQ